MPRFFSIFTPRFQFCTLYFFLFNLFFWRIMQRFFKIFTPHFQFFTPHPSPQLPPCFWSSCARTRPYSRPLLWSAAPMASSGLGAPKPRLAKQVAVSQLKEVGSSSTLLPSRTCIATPRRTWSSTWIWAFNTIVCASRRYKSVIASDCFPQEPWRRIVRACIP